MSFVEDPQTVDPIIVGQILDGVEGAPLMEDSHQEGAGQKKALEQANVALAQSDNDLQASDQAMKDSGHALVESNRSLTESDHALQESNQALIESGLDLQESDRALVQSDQASRDTDLALRETDHALRVSDRALRVSDQTLRLARRAMLETDGLFQLLVDSVTDYAIYMLDPEGRVITWNVGAERSKGYKAEEILGRNFSIFFLPEDAKAGLPADELAIAAKLGRYETEAWRVRKDGTKFWALITLTAVREANGELRGFAKVTRDLTEQKHLEESLAKIAADLEARVVERTRELEITVEELRRKNQEVEAFVYIVSHDLRAPLVNVQGFVRELEESCKHLKEVLQTYPNWEICWPGLSPILNEEMGGALHYISASAAKFERLIDALLGLSRQGRQDYHLTRVNVWDLATNAVATFLQAIIEAGAEVEVDELPSVTADATALGQVFSNLIGNCLKYRSPDRPLKIEVGGQVEAGMVHYWVRDNGLGIPEYGKTKLFQVFQRFHSRQAEGEGMGLAIALRIVERHGGRIWAESLEGQGSAFHFSLPARPVLATRFTQEATGHESV
jgi:PAS domain S-box-containing protein